MEVRIAVVDNATTDRTPAHVRQEASRFAGRLQYLFVPEPGKTHALNAGIGATDGDLVGLIDDDEEIDASWFECIHAAFSDEHVDFIGGKCLPRWSASRPEWLGERYLGVIGWVDPGPESKLMDEAYAGILTGGNAVVRRRILERAGPYSNALNRTASKLLGCEDEDMYYRLLALGARGRYVPELVIFHHVPAERLTKSYFRRWCFWRAVSLGVMDRDRRAPVPYLAGVPRYWIGSAARGLLRLPMRRGNAAIRFESELACWDLAGRFWGRFVHRHPNAHERAAKEVRV
jgi:GT2 family glycosyltransferase